MRTQTTRTRPTRTTSAEGPQPSLAPPRPFNAPEPGPRMPEVAGVGHDLARIRVSVPAMGAAIQRVRTGTAIRAPGTGPLPPRGGVIQRVKGTIDLESVFPKADRGKIKDYGRISEMLEDSQRVQGHLEELDGHVERLGNLEAALREMEDASGFKPPVNVSELLLEPQFMAHVGQGHQLVDPGAGLQHGPLTHRIQWWMAQNEINKAKDTDKAFNHGAADLYKGLADPELRFHNNTPGGETNTGWDAMFDRVQSEDVDRASRPEWFHPQMLNMGGEKQVLDTSRFPTLHGKLMEQYNAAHDETKGMDGVNAWESKPGFKKVDTPMGLVGGPDPEFNEELERQRSISNTAPRVRATPEHSLRLLPPEDALGPAASETRKQARLAREAREASQHQPEAEPSNVNDPVQPDNADDNPFAAFMMDENDNSG